MENKQEKHKQVWEEFLTKLNYEPVMTFVLPNFIQFVSIESKELRAKDISNASNIELYLFKRVVKVVKDNYQNETLEPRYKAGLLFLLTSITGPFDIKESDQMIGLLNYLEDYFEELNKPTYN